MQPTDSGPAKYSTYESCGYMGHWQLKMLTPKTKRQNLLKDSGDATPGNGTEGRKTKRQLQVMLEMTISLNVMRLGAAGEWHYIYPKLLNLLTTGQTKGHAHAQLDTPKP